MTNVNTPVTEKEWDDWAREQRYQRKEPLKRHLLAAQAKVKETLDRVIGDGETVVIHGDDGKPAAALVPWHVFDGLRKAAGR